MKKQLTEQEVIRIMREEWDRKVKKLSEEIDLMLKSKVGSKSKDIISKDLKIKSKKNGILYTVEEVGPDSVRLKSPDGEETLIVNGKDLEKNYELD